MARYNNTREGGENRSLAILMQMSEGLKLTDCDGVKLDIVSFTDSDNLVLDLQSGEDAAIYFSLERGQAAELRDYLTEMLERPNVD